MNPNGSLDQTFKAGAGVGHVGSTPTQTLCIQNDDKIIIGGSFNTYDGKTIIDMARLNSDGSLDTTFHCGTGLKSIPRTIFQQNDGKILLSTLNSPSEYNGVSFSGLIRLNVDGTVDPTFKLTGTSSAYSLIQQPDNKIINANAFGVNRLNVDGTEDNSFKMDQKIFGAPYTLTLQDNGKIIVAGSLKFNNSTSANLSTSPALICIDSTGHVDTMFHSELSQNNLINTVSKKANGQLYIGGNFVSYNGILRNYIARVNADGTIDKTIFNVNGTGVNGTVWSSAIQNDGRIIIGGLFSSYNGTPVNNIARLYPDGTLDNTFDPGKGTDDWVESIVIQPDGKIILGGYFSYFNGVLRKGIVRLNTNGSIDTTLVSSLSQTEYPLVEQVVLQKDGKIVLAGEFALNTTGDRKMVIRFNSDGTIDQTFSKDNTNGYVYTMLLQPDGKIIIGGGILSNNGVTRNNIVRLKTDGTIDYSFLVNTGPDSYVIASALQDDGKIIISGLFDFFDGKRVNKIARLNTDGTLDSTFNTGDGLDNFAWTIKRQNSGKIVLGGEFKSFNGNPANHFIRLNPDGSIDNTMIAGTGADDRIVTMVIQNDNKIVLGGQFNAFNGVGKNRVVRINGDVPLTIAKNSDNNEIKIYPNPTAGLIYLSLSEPADISVIDMLGKTVYTNKYKVGNELIDLSKEKSGIYFLKINDGVAQKTTKIVVSR